MAERFWITFKATDPQLSTVTVDRWHDWATSGDYIEKRGGRHFLVSHTTSIPRWRYWLNWIMYWWRGL